MIPEEEESGDRIDRQLELVAARVRSLSDTVLRLEHVVDERGRQTDAKINALIGVVERYFSNGKKPS
jgi:hypothetical protein